MQINARQLNVRGGSNCKVKNRVRLSELGGVLLTARPPPVDKLSRTTGTIVRGFTFQHGENDCEVAQTFNILHELSDRLHTPTLRLPYDSLAAVISPAPNYPVQPGPAKWIPKVQRMLPTGFRLRSTTEVSGSSWNAVRSVLEAQNCSFPVLGVSADYWDFITNRSKPHSGLDHDLALLSSDKSESVVFDPYAQKLAKRGSLKGYSGKGSFTTTQAVLSIPTSRLVTLWEGAKTGKYLLWIERVGATGTQLVLESRDWIA